MYFCARGKGRVFSHPESNRSRVYWQEGKLDYGLSMVSKFAETETRTPGDFGAIVRARLHQHLTLKTLTSSSLLLQTC